MEKLVEYINKIDEDYLVGLTNKGIVKRAQKDLEKEELSFVERENEEILVTLGDATCTLRSPLDASNCTCPSRTICKHIIMSILYVKETNRKASPEQKAETPKETESFTELKTISLMEIQKVIGEKKLYEIIHRINAGYMPKLTITSIITALFPEIQITVKLMEPLSLSSCTCQKKGICIHKAEAILSFQKTVGVLSQDNLETVTEDFNDTNLEEMGGRIKRFIEEHMLTGLSRSSPTVVDSFSRMAVICHNAELPNFERWFREISEEYNQYFKRTAAFRKEQLLEKLIHCYSMACKLQSHEEREKLPEIIGEFKSTYYELPFIDLAGIGSRDFKSKTGYEGTIYYFLELSKMEWYTYTKAMPTYYEDETRRRGMLSQFSSAPWNLMCKSEELSQMELHLVHCKINKQHRISSSGETKGEIIGKSNIVHYNLEKHLFADFKKLLSDKFINHRYTEEIDRLVFLKPANVLESQFDSIRQVLEVYLLDEKRHKIILSVAFSEETKYLIRTLERISKRINHNRMGMPIFFGTVYLDEGSIKLFPISCIEQNEKLEETDGKV